VPEDADMTHREYQQKCTGPFLEKIILGKSGDLSKVI
jgi:hypothetical protein